MRAGFSLPAATKGLAEIEKTSGGPVPRHRRPSVRHTPAAQLAFSCASARNGEPQPPIWRWQLVGVGTQAIPGVEQATPSGVRWQIRQPSLHSAHFSSIDDAVAWCRVEAGTRWAISTVAATRAAMPRAVSPSRGAAPVFGEEPDAMAPCSRGGPLLSTQPAHATASDRESRSAGRARRFRGLARNPSNPASRAARSSAWPALAVSATR